ncbi:adenine deaminase [Desulfomicrobium macestii]|uniref:Adenine deaminase n=2 Tax=Desulfomicrobium TaxID=898 RepID=A0A8G2C5B4_DESNO|nr:MULTISPECIES: adenine deaminase [Desulfomicrobium]MBE1424731.1 adenine deaminase [Desulfomicrobium macestii]SFM09559.1 adenine deaminase [Desulfomicrobium norvegicum]
MPMNSLLHAARGETPVDLLIRNCQVVNVLSGEIHPGSVGVKNGVVVGFGEYDALDVVDACGRHLCPGLVEGHIHIESTLLDPVRFAQVAASHGTAVVVCDPHELANVLGLDGIRWLLEITRDLPLDIRCMMPSCVPATHLETAGALITAQDIAAMFKEYPDRILGLAEMMNYPGVLYQDPQVMGKLFAAGDRPIDGHAPGLSGFDLNAYVLAGPGSDHEACHLEEALEKLRAGMHVMIREGSSEKNLFDLLPLINDFNSQNCSLVTDDRHCDDLLRDGHLDHTIRLAVSRGLAPMRAIQMASINTARYFGLRRRGAVAPGYRADFVLLDDLESFSIFQAYLGGRAISPQSWRPASTERVVTKSVHLGEMKSSCLDMPAPAAGKKVRVIRTIPGQIVTGMDLVEPLVRDGMIMADPDADVVKLAVFERHRSSGGVGLGLVRGLGLKSGAIAGTVAHDSHNLIVAGVSDSDMILAMRALADCGGGFVCVRDGWVLNLVPLPLAGLMSDEDPETVAAGLDHLNASARELGCPENINPFMQLSFLSLPVIPRLRLTDRGLVDVEAFAFTSLSE